MPLTGRMENFISPEPEVRLEKAFPSPFKSILTSARTCYSPKGVVREEDLREGSESLAESLYAAGHHTTIQHAHLQFSISNVSRHFLWSFLHSHPFYNSEQVSQRYVEVKPGAIAIPPLKGEALAIYTRTTAIQMEAYRRLADVLTEVVDREYRRIFPHRDMDRKKYRNAVLKLALEVARYVLPIATFAYLYHTISALTLLRYYRMCDQYDAPFEQRMVVKKMIDELLRLDPLYEMILEQPFPIEQTPEYRFAEGLNPPAPADCKRFLDAFDRDLGDRVSKLIDYKTRNEEVLADAVREVLGMTPAQLDDVSAIDGVLNPAKNPLLADALNLSTHSKLTRTLFHPCYTFKKRLSHTADSQDQRHRMTPASRPCLALHLTGDPDYITPPLVLENEAASRLYREVMERTWEAVGQLRQAGVSDEFASYLLPNAVSIRFTESADLLNLHHKHAMRLCYLAQEEIWRASLDEASQIAEVNPLIGKYLLPPCGHRQLAGTRPWCPEGDRYCGVPVWQLQLSQYERLI
ncbi:MAG: FAD-dependent thymidylate synthase [Acidobacteria bacterium]|nr:FAD-dependent thymidylate synthase [Acidobacteriota bacterium]